MEEAERLQEEEEGRERIAEGDEKEEASPFTDCLDDLPGSGAHMNSKTRGSSSSFPASTAAYAYDAVGESAALASTKEGGLWLQEWGPSALCLTKAKEKKPQTNPVVSLPKRKLLQPFFPHRKPTPTSLAFLSSSSSSSSSSSPLSLKELLLPESMRERRREEQRKKGAAVAALPDTLLELVFYEWSKMDLVSFLRCANLVCKSWYWAHHRGTLWQRLYAHVFGAYHITHVSHHRDCWNEALALDQWLHAFISRWRTQQARNSQQHGSIYRRSLPPSSYLPTTKPTTSINGDVASLTPPLSSSPTVDIYEPSPSTPPPTLEPEIFLDVVETLFVEKEVNGRRKAWVKGVVEARCFLPGKTPIVALKFNAKEEGREEEATDEEEEKEKEKEERKRRKKQDRGKEKRERNEEQKKVQQKNKTIVLDDITFHTSVYLRKFFQEKTKHCIVFSPPANYPFQLMRYHYNQKETRGKKEGLPIPLDLQVSYLKDLDNNSMHVEVSVVLTPLEGEHEDKMPVKAVACLPVPSNVASCSSSVSVGKAVLDADRCAIIWKFKPLPSKWNVLSSAKAMGFKLRAKVALLGTQAMDWVRPPATLSWQMKSNLPKVSTSGFKICSVRSFEAEHRSKLAAKVWARYLCDSASFSHHI
ncbi:Hyaluronan and proteoglycan link protein 1 [Balamuthia mandrillaris]